MAYASTVLEDSSVWLTFIDVVINDSMYMYMADAHTWLMHIPENIAAVVDAAADKKKVRKERKQGEAACLTEDKWF